MSPLTMTFGPLRVYSVKDYGATGNGTTDDTNAIEACRDAALAAYQALGAPSLSNPFPYGSMPIFFPAGEYVIRHPIDWISRVHLFGLDSRHTRIRARQIAAGGFSGPQMFRNWRDSDWTGGETDHRRAPQQMQAGSLDNVYPRISGLGFLTGDATNLACISWAGANESGFIRDVVFQSVFSGASNNGNWAIDLQDTRIIGGGHFNIAEFEVSNCHTYGTWERHYSFNNANVTDGSAPDEWGQDLWINRCSVGWDSGGTFHSVFYFNHLQGVTMTDCMLETNMKAGSQASIYGVNIQGLVIRGGNWDFLTPKGRTIDFLNLNMAAGLGQDRSGVSVRDVAISTGGSFVPWFVSGAAMIKDPYHTIQPDVGTWGAAVASESNPIGNIRNIDEGIIDVRLIDGTIGRLDSAHGEITGVTDVQLNQHYLDCPGLADFQGFTTPDAADLDLTTGCDLRALIQPTVWAEGTFEQPLVEKFTSTQRSYAFYITAAGKLEFYYSVDGTAIHNMISTAAMTGTAAPIWVRVVATANVASQCQAIFYTSTNGTTWTQFGSTQTNASGAGASWFSSTSQISVAQNENSGRYGGKLYRVEIRNLTGTLIAWVDARSIITHQTYTDTNSHLWTPDTLAVITAEQLLDVSKVPSGYIVPLAQLTTTTQAANYTLALVDDGTVVEFTKATAGTITIPPNSTTAFPIGTVIEIVQVGAGQITLTPGAGVTIRTASSLTTRAQWSAVGVRKRGTDEWVASGDLT